MTITRIPQIVNDAQLNWGTDLSLSATNDLLLVAGPDRGKQRVLRRLLTIPGSYIWENYGAGIPAIVGQASTLDLFDKLKSLIQSQIFLESAVAQTPPPEIFLQSIQGGLFAQVNYTDNATQNPIVITFNAGT